VKSEDMLRLPPPELEHIVQQIDQEMQELIDQIAEACSAQIVLLRMKPSRERPQSQFFYEQVVFQYARGDQTVEDTWYVAYMLRDACFNYTPWEVRGTISAFPSRMQEALRQLLQESSPVRKRDRASPE
jgi:hypothetical protein